MLEGGTQRAEERFLIAFLHCAMRKRLFGKGRRPQPLTSQEVEALQQALITACRRAVRPCTVLMPAAHAGDEASWSSGLLGAVRAGVPGESWPMEDELPMIGLFQIRTDELLDRPKSLEDVAYLRVWCGEQRWPRYPGALQREFLEIAMSGNMAAVTAFADKHAAHLTIDRDLDLDRICIRPITLGSEIVPLQTPDPDPILKPLRMVTCLAQDHPGMADLLPLEFMSDEEREPVQRILDTHEWSDSLDEEVARAAPNLFKTKVGGWPSPVQGQPDFGEQTEFVLQITGEPECGLGILDDGVLYIFRNIANGNWGADWTCH